MANFDELNGNMRALYEAAKAELAEMDKKRAELENIVTVLAPLFGGATAPVKKTYSVEDLKAVEERAPRKMKRGTKKADSTVADVKGGEKKPRIKEAVIYERVMKCLSEAPDSMSAAEIVSNLEKTGLPATTSFRTRIYGKLSEWTEAGQLERVERGVYRIKTPVK